MNRDKCLIEQDLQKVWLDKQGEKIEKNFGVLSKFLAKDELEEYNLKMERKKEAMKISSLSQGRSRTNVL
jgi:hypothetical protein